jgi:3-isopropylmalate/(R)-2-methylmalate dehydratase large subunit
MAPDDITFNYLEGREFSPEGKDFTDAIKKWKKLYSDTDAKFSSEISINAEDIEPMITWGTNPGQGMKITGIIPHGSENKAALEYMGFNAGEPLLGKKINYVFIGSCTNGRIEDFREVARIVSGKRKAANVRAYLVPGSKQVEKQIEQEGLRQIFEDTGLEVRQPGCSACLGMNEDKVPRGELCVSTSNRNFEGRQGPGARTILASPLTAAAVVLTGSITDVRTLI